MGTEGKFSVFLDGIELRHPITLDAAFRSKDTLPREEEKPLLFAGKCVTKFDKIPAMIGGGSLEFEGYFYWNGVVVPKENNGIIIRINGATGMLFDEKFLDYRVAELTRLRQITAEIFVTKGLDPALNIDRESFNQSHPHFQYIRNWVHAALRQATNKLKAINKDYRDQTKASKAEQQASWVTIYAEEVWEAKRGSDIPTPDVRIFRQEDDISGAREEGGIVLDVRTLSDPPVGGSGEAQGSGRRRSAPSLLPEEEAQVKALVVVLAAYGLIDRLSYEQLQDLLRDIRKIQTGGSTT